MFCVLFNVLDGLLEILSGTAGLVLCLGSVVVDGVGRIVKKGCNPAGVGDSQFDQGEYPEFRSEDVVPFRNYFGSFGWH